MFKTKHEYTPVEDAQKTNYLMHCEPVYQGGTLVARKIVIEAYDLATYCDILDGLNSEIDTWHGRGEKLKREIEKHEK